MSVGVRGAVAAGEAVGVGLAGGHGLRAVTVRRSTPSGVTSKMTPLPSRGSSSRRSPVTTNARSDPSSMSTPATLSAAASVGHAHELAPRPRRVGQRPDQVERGPHAQLPAHRASVAHARVEGRRMEVGEAVFAQRRLGLRRRLLDPQAERRHDIGAAGLRRHGAVAGLGDGHVRPRPRSRRRPWRC